MAWNDGLEGEPLKIAEHNQGKGRVIAVPGSGKTTAIIRMVARLLDGGEDPIGILVVTFTRMAAADLVSKVAACGSANADKVIPGTLHSLAFYILRQEKVVKALGRVARMLLPHERRPLVFDLSRLEFGKVPALERKEIPAFEAAWARLQSDEAGWPSAKDKPLHNALIAWLTFHQAMLVGELVPLALMFLRKNPINDFAGRYKWVVVDEYQDLNKAEQSLIQELAKKSVLLIAGDDDQSIYSFKYAHPEGIASFTADVDYPLPVCRRCPSLILTLARSLIESAGANRISKDLKPRPGAPAGEVYVLQWGDPVLEGRGIAAIITLWVKSNRFTAGDVLVLCPRRILATIIRDALEKDALESDLYYSENMFEEERAREALAILSLLAEPLDRVALRTWLGLGKKDWRAKEYNRIRAHCEKAGLSPFDALAQLAAGSLSLAHTKGIVEQFKKLGPALQQYGGLDLKATVEKALPAGEKQLEDLRTIALGVLPSCTDLISLMRRIRERITQPEVPTRRTKISIMTPHKAKGLEAELVVITSCVEGFLPFIDQKASSEEQQRQAAEGRRLFYVGITRTRQCLVISSFRSIPAGPAKQIGFSAVKGAPGLLKEPVSRYIAELGPSCPQSVEGDGFLFSLKT